MTLASSLRYQPFTPLPERLTTTMKYCEADIVLSGSVNPAVQLWAATSAYAPNQTASGHQPRGFDQIMALYEWFTVEKCRIKVTPNYVFAGVTQVTGVCLTAYNTLKTVLSDYTEMAEGIVQPLERITTYGTANCKPMHLEYDARKFMGVKDPVGTDRLLGTVAASPSDNAFFHVWASSVDESTSFVVHCVCELEYVVTFSQPVQVAES
jgi:hypothetical protein